MFTLYIFGDRSSLNPIFCGILFCGPLRLMLIIYPRILGPQVYVISFPMFRKGWCGQPINFLLFQANNAALGLSALLDIRGRLVIWRDLVGARAHCQRS